MSGLLDFLDQHSSSSDLGGKAQGLAWLQANGYRVPEWFGVSVQSLLSSLGMVDRTTSIDPSELGQSEFSKHFLAQLDERCRTLSDDYNSPLIVRSSFSLEDGSQASFAGLFTSVLGPKSLLAVTGALKECLESLFGENASKYASHFELDKSQQHLGCVVIQRLLNPDVAGVCFSANPTTGRRKEAVLAACPGLAEPLVQGDIKPDEFVYDYDAGEVATSLGDYNKKAIFSGGRVQYENLDRTGQRACLSEELVADVCGQVRSIAATKRSPQDCEWAIVDGNLYFIQVRPITKIPEHGSAPESKYVWDNSNIQESYCGVTTPLTFSFARSAYGLVYQQTMEVLGFGKAKKKEFHPHLNNLLGLVMGQVYYNIRNWHRGLLLFPSFKVNKSDMEKMMGVTESVDFIEDGELSLGEKLRRLPEAFIGISALLFGIMRLRSLVATFNKNFDQQWSKFCALPLHELEACEVFAELERFKSKVLTQWHTPIINDFNVMMLSGRLSRLLTKCGMGQYVDEISMYMATGSELASIRPTIELLKIARSIQERQPDLADEIRAGQTWNILARIARTDSGLSAEILEWINEYGDRTIGELKLETETPRQNEELIFAYIAPILKQSSFEHRPQESPPVNTVISNLKHRPIKRFFIQRALKKLRVAIAIREELRFARTKVFGVVRSCYVEIGRRISQMGLISDYKDVFFLTQEEIADLFDGCSYSYNFKHIIEERKSAFQEYLEIQPTGHIKTEGIPIHERHNVVTPLDGADALKGTGCSAGTAEGAIVKLSELRMDIDLNGKILCAMRTDPGWAPLFPLVKGVLIERGSTLSHSAIIARELGIPAIVGIPGLMSQLADGQRVTMDGRTGEVVIHEDHRSAI